MPVVVYGTPARYKLASLNGKLVVDYLGNGTIYIQH